MLATFHRHTHHFDVVVANQRMSKIITIDPKRSKHNVDSKAWNLQLGIVLICIGKHVRLAGAH
jgi:hypothetical protein